MLLGKTKRPRLHSLKKWFTDEGDFTCNKTQTRCVNCAVTEPYLGYLGIVESLCMENQQLREVFN